MIYPANIYLQTTDAAFYQSLVELSNILVYSPHFLGPKLTKDNLLRAQLILV